MCVCVQCTAIGIPICCNLNLWLAESHWGPFDVRYSRAHTHHEIMIHCTFRIGRAQYCSQCGIRYRAEPLEEDNERPAPNWVFVRSPAHLHSLTTLCLHCSLQCTLAVCIVFRPIVVVMATMPSKRHWLRNLER